MISCVRRVQFCAGHRVVNHESKCRNLHGHNYVALFHARAPELDGVGRVIDFGVLKERLGGWVDTYWDHGLVLWEDDLAVARLIRIDAPEAPPLGKWFFLPTNPTAENMAVYLLREVAPEVLEGTGVEVFKVTLWETENCYAEATL